jgi:hypothetical protein
MANSISLRGLEFRSICIEDGSLQNPRVDAFISVAMPKAGVVKLGGPYSPLIGWQCPASFTDLLAIRVIRKSIA